MVRVVNLGKYVGTMVCHVAAIGQLSWHCCLMLERRGNCFVFMQEIMCCRELSGFYDKLL